MIEKNEDGTYKTRSGDLPCFMSVIEEQCRIYSDFLHNRPSIEELSGEEIIRLNHNQIDPLYICTIFSAMYLEAFIFDYLARKRSSSFAKTIDNLDPPGKWVIGTELCNSKGIDTSKHPYERLKKLFSLRNSLAHNKSKEFDWGTPVSQQSEIKVLKPVECVNIIIELLEELVSIDPNEIYAPIVVSHLKKLKNDYPI